MRAWRLFRTALSLPRLLPHLVVLALTPQREVLRVDIARWQSIIFGEGAAGEGAAGEATAGEGTAGKGAAAAHWSGFVRLMSFHPEFRNLFYYRTGLAGRLFSPLCRPLPTLYITTPQIGPGLYIQHGFATIISARRIGRNAWINQQVTIGYRNREDAPVLGDDVTINAGAKVIGAVHVGDGAKVGANAVVVKDVPPRVTVVGVPARIVRRDGQRVDEAL